MRTGSSSVRSQRAGADLDLGARLDQEDQRAGHAIGDGARSEAQARAGREQEARDREVAARAQDRSRGPGAAA